MISALHIMQQKGKHLSQSFGIINSILGHSFDMKLLLDHGDRDMYKLRPSTRFKIYLMKHVLGSMVRHRNYLSEILMCFGR